MNPPRCEIGNQHRRVAVRSPFKTWRGVVNREFIAKHWYSSVYEQFENQTNDVDFLLKILLQQTGGVPLDILEVACGGGRISVPLAQAGHRATGFDMDEHMLLRCLRRGKGVIKLPLLSGGRVKGRLGPWVRYGNFGGQPAYSY